MSCQIHTEKDNNEYSYIFFCCYQNNVKAIDNALVLAVFFYNLWLGGGGTRPNPSGSPYRTHHTTTTTSKKFSLKFTFWKIKNFYQQFIVLFDA